MSWRAHIDRFFSERVILLVGWLWFLVYAYPGYMSPDSVWQLNQARGLNRLNDWHPPMMAFIWRYLDKVIAGPFPMLVLQSGMFLLGLYVLFSKIMGKRAAAITAAVLLVLPQNIIVMAVIWKDSQMAGFLVAAVACLLSDRRHWRILGYVLIFFATAVRYNAVFPTFPIVLVLFDWSRTTVWYKRYSIAFGLWIGITGLAIAANSLIVEEKVHPWPVGAAPVDIAGTLRFADDADLDQFVRDTPGVPWGDTSHMRARLVGGYRPQNSYIVEFESGSAIFQYPQTTAQRDALGKLWWKVVEEHPRAFLRHRTNVFSANLAAGVLVWSRFTPETEDAEATTEHRAAHSQLQTLWISIMENVVRKRFFRPRVYWLLSLILLVFCRREPLAFAFFTSGICHELGLFALAPAVDYRYSHWMIMASIIGVIILFVKRLRPQRRIESTP